MAWRRNYISSHAKRAFHVSTLCLPRAHDAHFVDPIRDRRSREAAFNYQPNFSANWISLPGVVVDFSTPAIPFGVPLESNMSVRSGVGGTAKFA